MWRSGQMLLMPFFPSFFILAQYVNCAAANPGADAGMYDASEQYKLSTRMLNTGDFTEEN